MTDIDQKLSTLAKARTTTFDAAPSRQRSLPTWLLPFALVVGFLAVLALLFGQRLLPAQPVRVLPVITLRSDTDAVPMPPPSTDPQSQQTANGAMLFQASGWIEPDPFVIDVPALVGGIVDEVFVLEGELVEKDQLLAKLINDEALLDLQGAQAKVVRLKAEIAAAQSRVPVVQSRRNGSSSEVTAEQAKLAELQDRLQRLESLPSGSIPTVELAATRLQVTQQQARIDQSSSDLPGIDSEIDQVKKEILAKEAALREAQVTVDRAQLALDRHTIRSPIAGRVLHLHAGPGKKRMVHMDHPKSAVIVELYDPEQLQARIDVPLAEAAGLSVGQSVEMVCDLLPHLDLKGTVTRISGEADLQRNTLQVKVAIEKPDSRLRPEMLVRGKFFAPAKIPAPTADDSTAPPSSIATGRLSTYVPSEAIFATDQIWVVSSQSTAERRTLSLATDIRDGYQLAIDGVLSGEQVILSPHTDLKPGTRVKIVDEKP